MQNKRRRALCHVDAEEVQPVSASAGTRCPKRSIRKSWLSGKWITENRGLRRVLKKAGMLPAFLQAGGFVDINDGAFSVTVVVELNLFGEPEVVDFLKAFDA